MIDSLPLIQARLKELIDVKVERRVMLLNEVAEIDRELAEARTVLNAWGTSDVPPGIPIGSPLTPVIEEPTKPKRRRQPPRMTRDQVKTLLTVRGPMTGRDLLSHYGVTDNRAACVFQIWVKQGYLTRDESGRFGVI